MSETATETTVNLHAPWRVDTARDGQTLCIRNATGLAIGAPFHFILADQRVIADVMAAAPDLLDFVRRCANDRDDCVSPGLVEKARVLVAKASPSPPVKEVSNAT